MYSQKLNKLVLVFTSIAIVAPSVSATHQPRHDGQSLHAPVSHQVADGGAPVPPYPPVSFSKTLVADGGAPVPPYPKPRSIYLMTDGGAPVPPYPKSPFAGPSFSANPQATLSADGGAPVPPYPPNPSTANLLAV
jgi:hypothetical protein